MQVHRLFEIVYILLDKKTVTAKEFSRRFEVSTRTIYRDVDTLSAAGIPIFTCKGKGGGISLLDTFVLNKSILTEQEQNEILLSLQSLRAVNFPDLDPVLEKMSAIFQKQGTSWIDADFSRWGSSRREQEHFQLFKTAILNKNPVTFDYFNTKGTKSRRTVEPVKLLFKGQGWYISGYCRTKKEFRLFKVNRIKNTEILGETFRREIPDIPIDEPEYSADIKNRMTTIVMNVEEEMAYRVYDEFEQESIQKNGNGSFTVTFVLPEDEWLYGYILSFGNYAEVLLPESMRDTMKRKLEESLKKYHS